MISFDTDTGYHLFYDTDHQIIGLGNICCPVAHIKVSVTDFPLIYSLTSSSEGGEKLSRAGHSLNFCPFCARHQIGHYFFLFSYFFPFFAISFSPLPFPSSKIFLSPKNLSFDAFSLMIK